jgi:hypothetical protein
MSVSFDPSQARPRSLYKSFDDIGAEAYGGQFSSDAWVHHFPEILGGSFEKAMTTGSLINPSLSGINDSAGPLKLENLDDVLTSVLLDKSEFVIFPWLNRELVTNNFYQFVKRETYGDTRGSAAFAEGGAPLGDTNAYTRHNTFVKYMGVRGGITHQLQVSSNRGGTMVDALSEENMGRTMELLIKMERGIMYNQKAILDESANEVNYDGLYTQLKSSPVGDGAVNSHIVDLRDQLSFTTFDNIALGLRTDGKLHSFADVQAFMTPNSMTTLAESVRNNPRYLVPQVAQGGARSMYYDPAAQVSGHLTQFGYIPFQSSLLLDQVDGGHPVLSTDRLNPFAVAAPTATVGAHNTGVASSQFTATSTGVWYFVSSRNSAGESRPAAITGMVTVGSLETIPITWNAVAGAISYRIYRNDVNSNADQAGLIAEVPQAVSPATTVTFTDTNATLPNTDICFIMERNPANTMIAQLSPLIKWPLAVQNTKQEFLLLLYHVPVLKAWERMYAIKNIKRISTT